MIGRPHVRAFAAYLALTMFATLAAPMPANAEQITAAALVRQAAISDMFETESSELAAIRSDLATRRFAATMNTDHQKSSSELFMAVKPHFNTTPIPPRMDAEHQQGIVQLQKLYGAEFTTKYHADQVAAHEAAVALFNAYAQAGSNMKLKAFAVKMLPTLRAHLRMARALAE